MPKNNIPNYAHHIIVPVANPETAPKLLQLATALIHPEEGQITALIVSLGDAEAESRAIEAIEPIVQKFQEEGKPVKLKTVIAVSAARGILDTVREDRADLLIIGVRQPVRGQVILGTIAENVATTAPCDVLIYRAAPKAKFTRVVIWANGSMSARVACQIGTLLGKSYRTLVEGMFVQSSGRSYWQGLARIEHSLADIPEAFAVKRTVITASDLISGLLTRVTEDDLLIVGFGQRSGLEKWLFGDFSQQLLNRAPGPVILATRSTEDTLSRSVHRNFSWLIPTLTRVEQEEIVRQAEEMASMHLDYAVLILIAAVLASLGLLLNSAAVIIGAMLVAPLMQPISAFSVGVITGRLPLMRRSAVTLIIGVLLALLLAFFTGWLVPTQTPTGEMLSRGSPTLLDAAVALASGIVGAYATARKGIPAALAGVAIAAALMPPICTTGMAIAFREPELAFGAGLLFVMNIAYISFAGGGVFLWMGMRPPKRDRFTFWNYLSMAVLVFLILPAVVILNSLRAQASNTLTIETTLEDIFEDAEIVEVEVTSDDPTRVIVTLRAEHIPSRAVIQNAETRLEAETEQSLELEVVYQRVIRAD